MDETLIKGRSFLFSNWEKLDIIVSDQKKGLPMPSQELPVPEGVSLYDLVPLSEIPDTGVSVLSAIKNRKSRRSYSQEGIDLQELSLLLYATQGLRDKHEKYSLRTVPSAGARHPFETYFFSFRVKDLPTGLYRYLPLSHKAALIRKPNQEDPSGEKMRESLEEALLNQGWNSAVTFVWTAVPYRTEWRYSVAAAKLIALDAGHLCQNLYLACEAIKCGTCAIGAYDQKKLNLFLGTDGIDEFPVYAAPVGKLK